MNAFAHYRAAVEEPASISSTSAARGQVRCPSLSPTDGPAPFRAVKDHPSAYRPSKPRGDPADSFDVVAPSLPGYGFSDRPAQRGMNDLRIADLWAKLMKEGLGYQRFAAQGGDWGAFIAARLGHAHPESVTGIHMSWVGVVEPYLGPETRELSQAERAFLEQRVRWRQAEAGYRHIQGTKPQTLAYGLNDSPAGLAAWLVDRIRTWGEGEDLSERRRYYTWDELLTNITIYWVTQTINSSNRLYYENQRIPWTLGEVSGSVCPAPRRFLPKTRCTLPGSGPSESTTSSAGR